MGDHNRVEPSSHGADLKFGAPTELFIHVLSSNRWSTLLKLSLYDRCQKKSSLDGRHASLDLEHSINLVTPRPAQNQIIGDLVQHRISWLTNVRQ